jgi:nickel/cobalt transporter (NiCoT) family protein
LSVAICLFIGTIELFGLLPKEIDGLTGSFWRWTSSFDINTAGFVIVGMFIACWICAVGFWKFGRVEEKWTARLAEGSGETAAE